MAGNPLDWKATSKELWSLRKSKAFLGGASNATYSVIEYAAQPFLMVLSARFLVSKLGVDRYGIWMLASAISGTIGIFHAGLSDATIKYVSTHKGRDDMEGVARIISGTLALSVMLGALAAGVVYLAAP